MILWPIKVLLLALILMLLNILLCIGLSDNHEFAANLCWWIALSIGFAIIVGSIVTIFVFSFHLVANMF